MRRLTTNPRRDWQKKLEAQGLTFHTVGGRPYWSEGTYYEFGMHEIESIETATHALHELCIEAAGKVIREGLWSRVGFSDEAGEVIRHSWERDDLTLYGRFDLAWTGSEAKLLEYNADTPTSLLEAAVCQWTWFEELFRNQKGFDQFNSIHEKLIAAFEARKPFGLGKPYLSFLHLDDAEDAATVGYLRDCAAQAGWRTGAYWTEEVGLDTREGDPKLILTDEEGDDRLLKHVFKLYPWEDLFEDYAEHLGGDLLRRVNWIEPAWKAVLSSKGILSVLWEMFPDHENLLETVESPADLTGNRVTKPFFSREGANVEVHAWGSSEKTEGPYGGGRHVTQRYVDLPEYDGKRAVIGSWVVDGEAAGMGIRESDGLITGNTSRFVPHVIFG